jgi:hypothetical protein
MMLAASRGAGSPAGLISALVAGTGDCIVHDGDPDDRSKFFASAEDRGARSRVAAVVGSAKLASGRL